MTNNGSSEGADPLVGQVLAGGLRVLARVGSTSEGPLYRAQYLQTGPPVALTVLRLPASMAVPSAGTPPARSPLTDRHWQLLRRACQIRHPNVAGLLEVKETPGGIVYATGELLSGELLADVLSIHGPLPLGQAVDICLQTAAGVEAAHRVRVAHGSISPHTILVMPDPGERPFVKLIRFDFSCYEGEGGRYPVRPADLPYASPERRAGGEPDPLDDVFSLGALLHYLVLGSAPGDGAPERPIPRRLRRVIDQALAPRGSRFQSVAELVEDLSRAPVSTTDEGPSLQRRVAVAVSILVAAAGLWYGQDRIRQAVPSRPEEVAVRPADSGADPPLARDRRADSSTPAVADTLGSIPVSAPVARRVSGPPAKGRERDSTHRSGFQASPAPRDATTGAALSPFRQSHPWAAHPDGQVYFRSSCSMALGSGDLLYFKSESEARATGRARSTTPGCF
jgi:serine/threonine protein kinase